MPTDDHLNALRDQLIGVFTTFDINATVGTTPDGISIRSEDLRLDVSNIGEPPQIADEGDAPESIDPGKTRITMPTEWLDPLTTAAEGGLLNLDEADDQKAVYNALGAIEKAANGR